MILNDIQTVLENIDENTYYGTTGDLLDKAAPWNYIVFSRDVLSRSSNKTSYTDVFNVAIVREEWIDYETIVSVIDGMESLAGIRLSDDDFEFSYAVKPSTLHTVEMLILKFTHSIKKLA